MPKSHSGTGVVTDKPTGSFQDSAKKIWDVSFLSKCPLYARLIGYSFALGLSIDRSAGWAGVARWVMNTALFFFDLGRTTVWRISKQFVHHNHIEKLI